MIEIIKTADGSLSLFDSLLDETYHSKHGAIQESSHVFIQNGLAKCVLNSSQIGILEVGFGTGLNALLSLLFNAKQASPKLVYYNTIDPFPLDQMIIDKFAKQFSKENSKLFLELHRAVWNADIHISDNFVLRKEGIGIQDFNLNNDFDLVYYDAFGPEVQPELWEKEALKKSVDALKPNGIWVSYCAKGKVRRMLESFNMHMHRLEGPPGKREMLMGRKLTL